MVSPANTYVGLTHSGPGTAAGEPGKYYPTGKRNYARVVAADDFQGAADATLAKKLRVTKLFILNDKEAYGQGVATNTKNAAKKLGINIVGFTAWDGKATSYAALALKIKQSGAQAVFLGGLICENGGKLIKDIRTGAPNVKILMPDGFTPVSADVQQSSGKAEGMYVSVAGLPNEKLPAAGQAFVKAFSATIGGATPQPYAVYAAQAAQVIAEAIKNSDGTRAGVADQLFKVNIAKRDSRPGLVQQERRRDREPGHDLPRQGRQVDDLPGHRPRLEPGRSGLAGAIWLLSGRGGLRPSPRPACPVTSEAQDL